MTREAQRGCGNPPDDAVRETPRFRASSLGPFSAKNGGSAMPSFGHAFLDDRVPPISRHYGVRYGSSFSGKPKTLTNGTPGRAAH